MRSQIDRQDRRACRSGRCGMRDSPARAPSRTSRGCAARGTAAAPRTAARAARAPGRRTPWTEPQHVPPSHDVGAVKMVQKLHRGQSNTVKPNCTVNTNSEHLQQLGFTHERGSCCMHAHMQQGHWRCIVGSHMGRRSAAASARRRRMVRPRRALSSARILGSSDAGSTSGAADSGASRGSAGMHRYLF